MGARAARVAVVEPVEPAAGAGAGAAALLAALSEMFVSREADQLAQAIGYKVLKQAPCGKLGGHPTGLTREDKIAVLRLQGGPRVALARRIARRINEAKRVDDVGAYIEWPSVISAANRLLRHEPELAAGLPRRAKARARR